MEDDCNFLSLVQNTQKSLKHIKKEQLQAFVNQISPLSQSANVFENILNSIILRLQAHTAKANLHNEVFSQIISKSQQFGTDFKQSIRNLLSNDFINKVGQKISNKLKPNSKIALTNMKNNNNSIQKIIKNIYNKSGKIRSQPKNIEENGQNIDNMEGESCLCNKKVNKSQQQIYKCLKCNYFFHKQCMGKKYVEQMKTCLKCHLKHMYPNKTVKKVLFVGRLTKQRKIHQFNVAIGNDQIDKNLKMHIRCIRLKYQTNFFMLFPDLAKIEINGSILKQFVPLHKLSSLKYRKDQPITISDYKKYGKQLNITINEQSLKRQTKQERIQPSDHLLAFFLIEDKPTDLLSKEIQQSCLNTFQDSFNILKSLFSSEKDSKTQDVILQTLQISLTCPLSTDSIKIAARGLYCRHFQCFDLHNYLLMIAYSANPKWICPICKKPSYSIRLDCILNAIIAANNHSSIAQEVKFYPNGDYCVSKGKQFIEKDLKNVKDLNLQSALKRKRTGVDEQEGGGKCRVICLD